MLRINPVSDGVVVPTYCAPGCVPHDNGSLFVGYDQIALLKFARPQPGSTARAQLSLNFLTSFSDYHDIALFGAGSAVGALAADDVAAWRAGEFVSLGTVTVLGDISSADVYVDVTTFVTSAGSPYLIFAVGAASDEVLSSLEENGGYTSQLLLTPVPEPSEAALMFAGLLTLAGWLRRRALRAATA